MGPATGREIFGQGGEWFWALRGEHQTLQGVSGGKILAQKRGYFSGAAKGGKIFTFLCLNLAFFLVAYEFGPVRGTKGKTEPNYLNFLRPFFGLFEKKF